MHNEDYIHRDLKLNNILLDRYGYIKVIDFGIARKLEHDEDAKTHAGTRDYISPEMANRSGYDKTTDWWSVGIILYEMLIGVNPFNIKNEKCSRRYFEIMV